MISFTELATLLLSITAIAMPPEHPPTAQPQPVTNVYHDVTVIDDFRWLEDPSDPEVRRWSAAQNEYARGVLKGLPYVQAIHEDVREILADESVSYGSVKPVGERVFAMKRQPPKQQPFLIVMESSDAPEAARTLVDPSIIDAEGTTTIDWYAPSPDGKLVAVSLSRRGTESGDVHLFDTATGKPVHETVPRVNGGTAGGSLVWLPDGTGFFYTRYPRGEERPPEDRDFFQQVYFHELGTPTEKDRYELGEGLPRIAEIQLTADPNSQRVLATVQDGDGGEFALFLRTPAGRWRQFSQFDDGIVQVIFGPDDDLILLSRDDAPRGKLLRLNTTHLDPAQAEVLVAEGDDTIVSSFFGSTSLLFADARLYVTYQLGGPSEIRVFDADGKQLEAPRQLPVSSVGGLAKIGVGDLLFNNESYTQPGAYFRFRPATSKTEATKLVDGSPVDLSDVKVVREMATSKDGTQVPLNILLPAGAKPGGNHPCVANAYGGYGISIAPRYRALNKLLLDNGVIYVVANIRGGGEYGDAWHRGGNLTNKQNVFDDFAAVLQHLIDRGYTSSPKLAIIGGSNGGLLMGATLTQHPDLMRAVVTKVGIYDMLRVEESPNGAFNIPEFGTVKNREQFHALRDYSPYHAVRAGTKYPATLLTTGENDPRVDPMQSRKMTAQLQRATASEAPILLRTSADTGHGADASLDHRIDEEVDVLAFLFAQLGVAVQDGVVRE